MNPVSIFTGTETESAIVRAALDEQGIEAHLTGANVAFTAPFLAPVGAGSVEVVVAEEDAERAAAIVEEFQRQSGE